MRLLFKALQVDPWHRDIQVAVIMSKNSQKTKNKRGDVDGNGSKRGKKNVSTRPPPNPNMPHPST